MNEILRIVDVNLNRSQEGLRVCEDITRFILNDKKTTRSFKTLRHRITHIAKKMDGKNGPAVFKSRNVKKDIGKKTGRREGRRKNILDIFCANIQRAKESLRVLEEIAKLIDRGISKSFKTMRFQAYELEKKTRAGLEALLHHR